MARRPHMNDATAVTAGVAATATLAAWVAGDDPASTSDRARTWAKHTLLDWLAVTIAGSREPLVDMLAEEYPARADGACALVGRGGAVGPIEAALINGSAGHALDFDDVSSRTVGHPTAPIAPAALALGQLTGASGEQLLRALVVGFEAQAFLGESLGGRQTEGRAR
ncbi:MAG: MmgE/PrpD family protein, partial [Burkholderiaceae bacterium]